jgi:hypothetical protein
MSFYITIVWYAMPESRIAKRSDHSDLHHHAQGRRQNVNRLAVQRKHFAIDHDIHRTIQMKINSPDRVALR